MVHILASAMFLLIGLAAASLVFVTLIVEQGKIALALGLVGTRGTAMSRRAVRVRATGRWQAQPVAVTSSCRAAA